MLSLKDRNSIIHRFPKLSIHPEQRINRLVRADFYRCIPKGRKHYAWFTFYKDQNVCLLVDTLTNNIHSCIYNVCFSSDLMNTVLYGTLFMINKIPYFTIEKVCIFKGKYVLYENFDKQFFLCDDIMDHYIKPVSYLNNTLTFGLPCIFTDYKKAISFCKTLPYQVYCIQFLFNKNSTFKNYMYIESDLYAHFEIKPDILNDIYHLFCLDDTENKINHSFALINDYKTSVMMNKLFRTIKENENLDTLEESDEEEEFENTDLDKYVDLEKTYVMKCEFQLRLKKWIPIEMGSFEISKKNFILQLEKNTHL